MLGGCKCMANGNKYRVGHPEFLKEAEKLGLTGHEYYLKLLQEGVYPNPADLRRKHLDNLANKKGFSSYKEQMEDSYRQRGYVNKSEYYNEKNWNSGKFSPYSENEECPQYLGVHIGEEASKPILVDLFGGIEKIMRHNYPWYEFVVKGGYKIDVKTATLDCRGYWEYHILRNNVADYFLLLAYDDMSNMYICHVWLVKKDEMIRKRVGKGYVMKKFYDREGIKINSSAESLDYFKKYELSYKSV